MAKRIVRRKRRPAKRPFKNDIGRSRLIFSTLQLMKGKKPKDISEITRRNGQKGVCYETVRKFYLPVTHPNSVKWPSSRTLESIIYSLNGELIVRPRAEPAD
jgi:hypothetical protein